MYRTAQAIMTNNERMNTIAAMIDGQTLSYITITSRIAVRPNHLLRRCTATGANGKVSHIPIS